MSFIAPFALRSFVSYMGRAQNMRRARALFRMEVIRKKRGHHASTAEQTTKGSSWVTDWQKTYMTVVADALFFALLHRLRYTVSTPHKSLLCKRIYRETAELLHSRSSDLFLVQQQHHLGN